MVDGGVVVQVAPDLGQDAAHVGIDPVASLPAPGPVVDGVQRALLGRGLRRRGHRRAEVGLVGLLRPVDQIHEPVELGDPGVGHVRAELVDHLAALGSPVVEGEHLEDERGGDQPHADDEHRDHGAPPPTG